MPQKLKRYCVTALALLFMCISALAQNSFEIKGRVTGADNQPLEGVSVKVKGTQNGTVTAKDGSYRLLAANGRVTLVFSSVGFTAKEEAVNGRNNINTSLSAAAAESLDDVVVIGYQTVKRKNLLASVASVGAKDLKDIPINSAAEALSGRLAGVTATTAEGSPDADIRIRVRGGMSITGDNSPLYIVDGVQVENGLSALSPQNIESIDVLKDAAATAIYGARGANGVIVITTKSGKPGRMVVSYNGFVGVKSLAKRLKVQTPYDYVIYQSERARGSSTDSATFARNFGTTWDTLSNYRNVSPVDWQEEVMGRTGIMQTHNIAAMGGNKKITYNFGYTYNDDKAIVLNSNYRRHLLNLKTDYKILNNLKLAVTARYTNTDVLGAGTSSDQGTSYNRLRNAVKYRPFLSAAQDIDDADPLADPNVGNGLNLVNPISLANAEYRRKTTDVFNVTAAATYTIVKNLSFKSTIGYDQQKAIDRQFSDTITPFAIIQGGRKAIVTLDTLDRTTITNTNTLTYSVNGYKDKHDFTILVGQETYDLRTERYTSQFRDYPTFTSVNDALTNTSLANKFAGFPRVNKTRYTSLSFFSALSYAYEDKYYFSFNLRADGASKFAPGRQWGYFPSGSVAWRAKNEKFLKNVNFLSDLKFRAGFGTVGNNRIADYLFLTTFRNDGGLYYGMNNEIVNAFYSAGLVNESLRWESTVNKNFGVDIGLFKNRVNLSVDIYNNSSKDLLLNVPIAPTYGYTTQLQNVGKTTNKGVEFQISATPVRNKNFSWTVSYNMSFNNNNVEQLGLNQKSFFPAASWGVSGQPTDYIIRIGSPTSAIWGLVTDGFYKVSDFDYNTSTGVYTLKAGVVSNAGIIGPVQPGSIRFKDLDGDGTITLDKDRQVIGNPLPKFTGGLNQQFTYKNWDMSVFMNFSYGNDVYNANKIEFTNGYTANSNMLDIMTNRWKVVTATGQTAQYVNGSNQVVGIAPDQLAALNANATIWQPLKSAGAFYPHSWAIEDGSFLRINNVTIGYSLPVKQLAGLKMSKLRFYFTGNNLAIFTKYTGYDPEVSVRNSPLTQGLDYSAYPKSRTFIFGVNATF
ncbi:SusC/RagA family TonB-linked outer membrane protein [Sediminibacterium goheungense]|uniref:TonB-linked SusC/RagA family outer membrane protein n=1 Tax=Sediminibacterium goheungense TaxID=1086393 RepID=A0A4R6J3N3_9BACT|nr:TonB-dependent receptor [Sediminibacterium goheungense]TDO28795.1 TonB-linked SusC/RagA family outer membrane protein [Sediminibacterium goheungense]